MRNKPSTPEAFKEQLWNTANDYNNVIQPILRSAEILCAAVDRAEAHGNLGEGHEDIIEHAAELRSRLDGKD